MTTQLTVIDQNNYETAMDEVVRRFYDIPFENSAFQTENFVLAAQITPERAYRSLGLRLQSRLQALQEAKVGALKEEIDIEELQEKIADPNTNKFDRRRFEIDIQQKITHRPFTQKLLNDAVHECNLLYSHMQKFPEYTREDFEAGERKHFTQRLTRAVNNVQGAAESLVNMDQDFKTLMDFENGVVSKELFNETNNIFKLQY